MDGTRRARLIALSATLVFGLTLFSAALMATTQQGSGAAGTVSRTQMTILTGSPTTGPSADTPRTTPPPTVPIGGAGGVRPLVPSAAMTVEHS